LPCFDKRLARIQCEGSLVKTMNVQINVAVKMQVVIGNADVHESALCPSCGFATTVRYHDHGLTVTETCVHFVSVVAGEHRASYVLFQQANVDAEVG
jgi:hypothetical protein